MKFPDIFRKPSATALAQAELDEARRKLLDAQSGLEYADAMVRYESARVRRLEAVLAKEALS